MSTIPTSYPSEAQYAWELATLFPEHDIEIQHITGQRRFPGNEPLGSKKQDSPFTPVPPGSYNSAAIIMLTDGQRTTGPDPLEAAKMAADRGVRIYTVGIGTKDGETIGFEGWSMRVRLDEDALKAVAQLTRADYFYAGTPPAGTWLSTHWNTYNSRFLLRGPLGGGTPVNVAPTVDAGPNRSVQLGQQASLDATVTDDGLPAGAAVTVAWAKASGPGTVTFASPASVDTTAGFSAAGTYTLALTASDTQLSASDTVTVTVTSTATTVTRTFTGSL